MGIQAIQRYKAAHTQPAPSAAQSAPQTAPAAPAYTPPEISYEGRKPVGEKIDPATISKDNQGNFLDLDGDGVTDHVVMRANTLYFAKGTGNNQFQGEIPILVIKGDVMAYVVQPENIDGKTQTVIHFWNSNRDGYFQRCLGVNGNGIPYFGEIETESK